MLDHEKMTGYIQYGLGITLIVNSHLNVNISRSIAQFFLGIVLIISGSYFLAKTK